MSREETLDREREIRKWCDETPERRRAVMDCVSLLQLVAGGKPAKLIAEASRIVYARREKPKRPSELVAPGTPQTWWCLADRRRLKLAALGEIPIASVPYATCEAKSYGEARWIFEQPEHITISQLRALETIEDLKELMKDAGLPLGVPTSGDPSRVP